MEELRLFDNVNKSRYEFHISKYTPFLQYERDEDEIYLIHTEVPSVLMGWGLGSLLVEKCLNDIENKNLRAIPMCPFVTRYIKKNPAWMHLVMKRVLV